MGLLSTDEKAAIATLRPTYRQAFAISVPRASGSSTFDAGTIHDDMNGPYCVIDANSRDVEGYNQSLAVAGNLTSGMYRFAVGNSDGMFYPATAGNWFYNSTGSYQATPSECQFLHNVYVKMGSSWSLLNMVAYSGKIQSVEYDDNKMEAVIEVRSYAAEALEYVYTEDDGTDEDTGMNVTWP